MSQPLRDRTTVYLVRHGETDWNRDQRLQGTLDVSLNDRGVAQAQELADHFSGLPLACVVTSPLLRAAATADAVADRCGCPLVIDPRLREVDHGSWTARTLLEIAEESPQLVADGQLEPAAFDVSGGETLRDVFVRVSSALADIVIQHNGQSVAIVSHGVALALIMCAAAGAAPSDYRDHMRPNATVATLTFGEGHAPLAQEHPTVSMTRRVTDGAGRQVEVPDTPRRIVTLTPSLAEMTYSIGAGDAIVGVSDNTDYPDAARTKPRVGGIVDPSIEHIVALHPDLVLATLDANHPTTIDAIQHLGIPVFAIHPEGLEGILQSVEQIGSALNRGTQAHAEVGRLRARLDAVGRRVAGLPKPRAFVLIWPDPVMTVGKHAFITEAIEAAGAVCVTRDLPQEWPRLSLEEVVRLAPDTLVLIANGHPTLQTNTMKSRPGWDRVPAVVAGRFVEVDARLQHSSPAVFDAIEQLAASFHQEAFQKAVAR